MEASGTSGQKASVNGVINFSVLDGWWAEAYNQKNGWRIGYNSDYESYEAQDVTDSQDMYDTLENKIIPIYYEKDKNGMSKKWIEIMKESIISTGGNYSTARMVTDYADQYYMPLCKLYHKYYEDLSNVAEFNSWKKDTYNSWKDVSITQSNNLDNITIDAGNCIEVKCQVELANINPENIMVECYYGKILENGVVEDIQIIPMKYKNGEYETKIELKTGGNYGYTFRMMPKHEMLLEPENMNLIKWVTKS